MSYDPELGRWLERDPLGYPDGMNAYEVETSNPVVTLDPNGLETYRHVFQIEAIIEEPKLIGDSQVEFKVRGSYWTVTCECESRNKERDTDQASDTRILRRTRGRNVSKDNVRQFVEEAILPSLPAWAYGGANEDCFAALEPDSFFPLIVDVSNWTPGKVFPPRTHDTPTTKPSK